MSFYNRPGPSGTPPLPQSPPPSAAAAQAAAGQRTPRTPRTGLFPSPQPMASRNASMMGFPSISPEAHRYQMLQRAHSMQHPGNQTPDQQDWQRQNAGGYTIASELLPHHYHHDQHHTSGPFLGSPLGSTPYQHFSPRRKRLSGPDQGCGSAPRRIRRRLFFQDGSDDAEAPEAIERRTQVSKAASQAALGIIRESVEIGESHLDLSDLGLDAVPDELAELKDLVVLTPGHTLAIDLQLTLSSNRLAHFPLAACELTNLTTLIISNNRIAHLPPEIANLRALRELSVANNRLRTLPLELTRLQNLQILSVVSNPLDNPPDAWPNALHLSTETWPYTLSVANAGVPRLSDLAARRLTRPQLAALKHQLAQCLESTRPALGRIVGPAVENSGDGVLSALRAQHLALPEGHLCASCRGWFLAPAAEVIVWAPFPPLLVRPAPFRVRLCSRNCLYTETMAAMLRKA